MEKVAVQDGDSLFVGRKVLRDALFATSGHAGLTANLTCNQYGDCAGPKIVVYETFSPDPALLNPGADADATRERFGHRS